MIFYAVRQKRGQETALRKEVCLQERCHAKTRVRSDDDLEERSFAEESGTPVIQRLGPIGGSVVLRQEKSNR